MKHRHFRLDLDKQTRLFWNGLRKPAHIENLSLGGALVRADIPAQIGDCIAVRLEDKAWPITMEVAGEIIRRGQTRLGVPAFAMKFTRVPQPLRSFLRQLIENRRAMLDW